MNDRTRRSRRSLDPLGSVAEFASASVISSGMVVIGSEEYVLRSLCGGGGEGIKL